MKILIVLPNDSLGGAEQYLKMIAGYYRHEKVDVLFLKCKNTGLWSDLSTDVSLNCIHTRSEVSGLIRLFCRFLVGKEQKYDYIYTSHVFVTGLIGILIRIGKINKDKFIARESTLIFQRYSGFKLLLYKIMYHSGYPVTDVVICQTNLMMLKLLEHLPWLTRKTDVRVIHNPIDLVMANKNAEDQSDKYEINSYKRYIVSAGRLIPEKGFDILIRAFSTIRGTNKDLRLVILGEGKDRELLCGLVDELKLNGYVFLPGHKDNIFPYLKDAQLCVISSRIEGFPNVLLQMMSQNANVISTTCAGGIDQIPGLPVCKPDNLEEMVRLINENLNLSADNQEIRVHNFGNYLKQNSIESFIKQIEK